MGRAWALAYERSLVQFPADYDGVRKCSCATLVQVRRPILILEIKNQVKNIKVSDNASQGIETINRCQFFLSIYFYLIVTLTILSANNVCDAKDSIHNYKSRTEV